MFDFDQWDEEKQALITASTARTLEKSRSPGLSLMKMLVYLLLRLNNAASMLRYMYRTVNYQSWVCGD